jgi:N-acetyl-gamma-glutamyl-phosphate reductase
LKNATVGIIGGSGYVAGELIKLLLVHPHVKLGCVESEQAAGRHVGEVHRFLYGLTKLKFRTYTAERMRDCVLVFVAKPHGQAMDFVHDLLAQGIRVVDISADFRLQNEASYATWYKLKHKYPQLLKQALYGLPELYKDKICDARLVANPGCYPTSVILGLAPLFADHIVRPEEIEICAYSGLSGAGRTPQPGKNLFIDAYRNLKPYKVNQHPHIPEIEQELSRIYKDTVKISFIPHLAPLDKGILSTIYLKLQRQVNISVLLDYYREFYSNRSFIRIYPVGYYPETANVLGTNFCDIGLDFDTRNNMVIVFSAIDNTLKGASGQAVQNMNIMLGFEESAGLPHSIRSIC